MIVRALFTLIVIFLVYKIYQRVFRQKRCTACGKMIYREAAICHHCNTIQDGVELVQAKADTVQAVSGKQGGRKQGGQQAMLLLMGAMTLIVLCVTFAVWFMQSM